MFSWGFVNSLICFYFLRKVKLFHQNKPREKLWKSLLFYWENSFQKQPPEVIYQKNDCFCTFHSRDLIFLTFSSSLFRFSWVYRRNSGNWSKKIHIKFLTSSCVKNWTLKRKLFKPFQSNVPFPYPLKTRGFLTFSGGIEMEHMLKMG